MKDKFCLAANELGAGVRFHTHFYVPLCILWIFLKSDAICKKRNGYCSGAYMSSDSAANRAEAQAVSMTFPEGAAVFDIFLQKDIAQSGITKSDRTGKIDAAFLNFLYQEIVALF